MGSLTRRVIALERARLSEARAYSPNGTGFEALSVEELLWLEEPIREAAQSVACPRHRSIDCVCSSSERDDIAIATYPEVLEEWERRFTALEWKL